MAGITELIPLRCQGCHLFYEDIQRAQAFEAELDTLDQQTEQDRLVARGYERKEIERRLARALLALGFLKEKFEYDTFYTVGCPGFDMSDSSGTGEAVWIGRCRSQMFEL